MKAWLYHWLWTDFYVPVWPNLAASAVLGVLVLLKLRALRKLHAEARDLAAKAHRIAADTHRHVTGKHHPDAPGGADEPETKTPLP